MAKKTTIKDVAKKAGVSHATVSMIFSGKKKLSAPTKAKVLAAARSLKYVPNWGASNLRSGESRLIGFIVNDLSNPIYGKMIQVAETMALADGYQVIVADHQWDPEAEYAAIRKMMSFRAKGLIWCGTEKSEASLDLLKAEGAPYVVALDSCPRTYTGSYFRYDTILAGQLAARQLVASGCRSPALFTAKKEIENVSSFVDLKIGFFNELKELGITLPKTAVINAGISIENGREAYHRIRNSAPNIDGILAINDLCAYGIMWGADEAGVKVGEDLALIGIGNLPVSSIPRISLTSIGPSPEPLTRLAMSELLESFKNKRPPSLSLKLECELTIRRSCQLKADRRSR